jgi:putative nucleotidyltransferase with HDIG domain
MTSLLCAPDPARTSDSSSALASALERCGDGCTHELVEQLEAADATLVTHGAGVAQIAVGLGRRLGITGERLVTLCRAALLHDIGKRYVPREVLSKPGPLLTHERQLVEAHPAVGASMLLQAGLRSEAAVVRHHHERWDGTGYPDRLQGDAIPLESRIILVADTFDAMTSDRPYRGAIPRAVALAEIEHAAGSQLDPYAAAMVRGVVESIAAA